MFTRFVLSKKLIAFLIPITFVWGWAACSLLCGEIVERHEKQSILVIERNGENCLLDFDLDNCPMTANTAIIESRQKIIAPVLAFQNKVSLQSYEDLFIPISVYSAEVRQNSPPHIFVNPPLFLRHCTFRI